MSRPNQVLSAILVLQVALAVVVFWPRSTAVDSDEPLLADLEVGQIVQLSIQDLEQGELFLAKSGEGWVLPGAGDYPCKDGAVESLLGKVVALTSDRVVTNTRSSHKRLQVADEAYMRLVQLKLADGTLRTFYVGSSPSYGVSHLRLRGQDAVYLVSGLSASDVDVRASSWIDTAYVSLDQAQVYAVSLENANGRFVFTKNAEALWTLAGLAEGETLKQSAASSLVSRAASLRMLRPLGTQELGSYGMGSPRATITLQTRDEAGTSHSYTLVVGSQDPADNAYVVKYSDSDYFVAVAEYTVQEWVDKKKEDLLEPPPTPVPQSGS